MLHTPVSNYILSIIILEIVDTSTSNLKKKNTLTNIKLKTNELLDIYISSFVKYMENETSENEKYVTNFWMFYLL